MLPDVVRRQEAAQHAEAHVTLKLRRPERGILLVARCDFDFGVRHRHRRHHWQGRGEGLLPLKRGALGLQPAPRRVRRLPGVRGAALLQ